MSDQTTAAWQTWRGAVDALVQAASSREIQRKRTVIRF